MIGYYITHNGITDSNGNTCQSDFLAWLLKENTKEDGVFPNLDYAVACLLHLIKATKPQGQLLLKNHHQVFIDDNNRPFTLSYYQGKTFSIDFGHYKNHCWRTFYNMEQYKDFHFSNDNSIEYAISQAKEAKQVGEQVLKAYQDIGITSNSLTSPIKAFIKSNLYPPIPTVDDIPEDAGLIAYQCLHGNFVETYQIGHFDNVFDYDLNGAYGHELTKLYDIRRGYWTHCPDEPPRAVYGFCKGILNIKAPFHSFLVHNGESQYTPTGTWEGYITKAEWNFLNEYHLGTFQSQDAWWWSPRDIHQYQPFLGIINRLWHLRQDSTPMTNKILKRIITGIWGLTGQTTMDNDILEFGQYFNPVYHALVESNCRLKVAKTVLDNNLFPEHLINIAVDGIVTTKAIPAENNNTIGEWRLTHRGKGLAISSGIVGIENKGGDEDFAITYDKLISLIKENPLAEEYTMTKLSPVTLARAINSDRWDDLGKLETTTRTITVQGENKRLYLDMPTNGESLLNNTYQSSPMDISLINQPLATLDVVNPLIDFQIPSRVKMPVT